MRLLRSCQQRILRCPPPPPSAAHPPASPSARSRSSASAPARRANPDPRFVRARLLRARRARRPGSQGPREIGLVRADGGGGRFGVSGGVRSTVGDKIGGSVYDGKAVKGLHDVVVYNAFLGILRDCTAVVVEDSTHSYEKDYGERLWWQYELSAHQVIVMDDADYALTPMPTIIDIPVLHDLSKDLHISYDVFVLRTDPVDNDSPGITFSSRRRPLLRRRTSGSTSTPLSKDLRTIPVDAYALAENIVIYAAISAYVGGRRGVQGRGEGSGVVLVRIEDLIESRDAQAHIPRNLTLSHPRPRPAQPLRGPAHFARLLRPARRRRAGCCGSAAAEGWTSSSRERGLTSSVGPRYVRTPLYSSSLSSIFQPYAYVTPQIRRRPTLHDPLLFWHDAHIIIQYARHIFTDFLALPRSATTPPITEAQAYALDAVNNLSVFHERDGSVDSPEHKRLWLRDGELAWNIPEALELIWKRLYQSATPETGRFPPEPENRDFVKEGAKYA
ncbi:hypothetical protein BJ912DRAFT_1060516 [Pholiota molesta]|nr:hypothetical protein BJ912DRAFT_1060516 [Pholiota molesta]